MIARIIAVAEAYDAMTSELYSNPVGSEKALLEMKRQSGIKFDPAIVDVFIEMMTGSSNL